METKTNVKANEDITDNNNGIEVYNRENVLKDNEKTKKKIIIILIIIFIILFIIIFLSVYLTRGKEEKNIEVGSEEGKIFEKCNLDKCSQCDYEEDSLKCKECNFPYKAINGICEKQFGLIEVKFKNTDGRDKVRLIKKDRNYL